MTQVATKVLMYVCVLGITKFGTIAMTVLLYHLTHTCLYYMYSVLFSCGASYYISYLTSIICHASIKILEPSISRIQ